MPIPPLYGHEGIRNRLAGAIASGRLPQSLLLEGPRGVGKQRLALWLAQALVCEDRGKGKGEGCGACQHCKLVLSLSHPDVHWFVPVELSKKGADADKQVELVAEALGDELAARRERPLYEPPSGLASHNIASVRLLLRRLALTPALARRKVFILGDAERLVPQTGADVAQRVAAAEGRLGRLLATEDRAAGGAAAAERFRAAVQGDPVGRYAFALGQQPFQARGGFTDMLDGLLAQLRDEARAGRDTEKVVEAIAQVLEARGLAQGNVNPQLVGAVLAEDLAGEAP